MNELDDNSQQLNKSVYSILLKKILNGDIASGSTISELALSKELGVSRTPVHNAVQNLIKDGVVEQVGNKRPFVTSFTPEKIEQLYEVRILLECEAVRIATNRIDDDTLAYLKSQLEKELSYFEKTGVASDDWPAIDMEMHVIISQTCANEYLRRDIERYWMIMKVLLEFHSNMSIQTAGYEHRRILDGIEARDPEQAAAAMKDHIVRWKNKSIRQLQERLGLC